MNVYIPIEVKIRELESKVLLAMAAAEKGFDVIIGSKDEVLQPVVDGKVEPGIVHMKSVTPSESMLSMLDNLHQNGCVITALDEEGGIIDEDFKPFGRLRFSDAAMEKIDTMFCWGPFDQNSLQSMFPDHSDKFIATGSPRVDLWKKEFHEFHLSKESGLTDAYGKFVLLSSNFGTILNENRIPNMIARMREAGYFDRDPDREDHEYQNAAYQTQLIWEFVKLFRYLSKEFPEINFIIRPHPVESLDSWKMLIGDAPNIHVLRQGSITPWVLNSVCVIHNGCTTGLEAAFFGKNVIAYRPIPSPIEREIPNSVSFQAFSSDQVISKLKNLLEQPISVNRSHDVEEVLKSRFSNFHRQFSIDAITEVWTNLIDKVNETKIEQSKQKTHAKQGFSTRDSGSLTLKFKRFLYRAIYGKTLDKNDQHSRNKSLLKSEHKFPELRDSEIEEMVNAYQEATSRFKDINYVRVSDKSFRFQRRLDR